MMIRHFNIQVYGQDLGYGRVRVFADLTHVHNTVEFRHYLYRCANCTEILSRQSECSQVCVVQYSTHFYFAMCMCLCSTTTPYL